MRNTVIRIIKYLFITLFLLTAGIYIFLNLYVRSSAIKITPERINNESTVELSEEQVLIISCLYANKKSGKFDKLPLIMDMFSGKNQIAYIMASSLVENKTKTTAEWRFIVFGTKRYIEEKLNYRDCCNYLCTKFYYGNGIYGLDNAADFYLNKNYKDLTQEEFIKIMLPTLNPIRYDILDNNQRVDEKILEIQNKM